MRGHSKVEGEEEMARETRIEVQKSSFTHGGLITKLQVTKSGEQLLAQ